MGDIQECYRGRDDANDQVQSFRGDATGPREARPGSVEPGIHRAAKDADKWIPGSRLRRAPE
ncbi:hypothetical protein BDS110ZK25_44220 [Bradyrhizobium diazoefficiens]|uniref:Uncharacterized protein n=1 Tax=Bradyrhizobium diazoefficiens TaxID=1355477 RepID=A0A809YYA6_9BRAD|nr:hypothetical protein F07S3_85060 [Bradyrhizobium diazoefficiens]BCA07695.1 hypothetical protein H12S4_85990 [Bradyrhizobium diazoefficiens]BCA16362.1 hypothetical protein BDHF08_82090 [Bradyrhizobium diazoefficiens]BCA25049.1 hypothetical protein BDHH15_82640 [Bradyrhizobium diazoefficiens]BCE25784.1 hypothetical protein XF1B_84650 [Bradyrhizobium diazoefficiens]